MPPPMIVDYDCHGCKDGMEWRNTKIFFIWQKAGTQIFYDDHDQDLS
jgi:hypothetical protein